MQLQISSKLSYEIYGPSTFLFCLHCHPGSSEDLAQETFSTDPAADIVELNVGMAGNRFTRISLEEPGSLTVDYGAALRCNPEVIDVARILHQGIDQLGASELPYLFPSRYAPTDLLRSAANDLFGHIENPFDIAIAVEDWLYGHLAYEAGSSNEQSSALDTYISRAGVCRDFAHLGISFCRAMNIPSRYVTAYAHQLEPQDFHAVFEVFIGGTWYLVDGTRRAPLNGMVRIATGRDASDVSVATLFGNVAGTGVEVAVALSGGAEESFTPITRADLLEKGQALYIR